MDSYWDDGSVDQMLMLTDYNNIMQNEAYGSPRQLTELLPVPADLTSGETAEVSLNSSLLLCESPEQLFSPKKRKRGNKDNWKKNKRKKLRNMGEEYVSTTGKIQQARCLKEACTKCPYKCSVNLPNELRSKIFNSFWEMGNFDRQSDFIAGKIQSVPLKRMSIKVDGPSRRKESVQYKLGGFRVCKRFFLNTLDISQRRVRSVLEKKNNATEVIQSDQRGKHIPKNKITDAEKEFIIQHIKKFPKVPSHWCRADTQKHYLEESLNKETMYNLYRQYCEENNTKPVGKTFYKEILYEKNIGFHTPKKDACWCYFFDQLSDEEKAKQKKRLEEHTHRKNISHDMKKADKERAKIDPTFLSGNFDLQGVLYCPLFYAKPLFYKRKYASFNSTFYTCHENSGTCFLWGETNGNRGSNEIGTCLFNFLKTKKCLEASLFSDSCGGQNKNGIITTAMVYIIKTHPTLKTLDIKFLEPGHTHMECDSIHASIETSTKYVKINVPQDWVNVIALAKKKGQPYSVIELKYNDIIDFKAIRKMYYPNLNCLEDGSSLICNRVKWCRVEKNDPEKVMFKYDYDGDFKVLRPNILRQTSSHKRREVPSMGDSFDINAFKAYNEELPISGAKHKDLNELCRTNVIDSSYHSFYKELKTDAEHGSDSDDEDIALSVMRERLKKRKK